MDPVLPDSNEASSVDSRGDVPHRLLNRDFFLLWQGQFVSQIGSQAFIVAMMFWTMEATGSASLMGVLMMLSMLPGVLLAPLGGTVADRYPRKAIIIVADLTSGVGVSGIAVLFFWKPEAIEILIAALFLISVLNGVVMAFFRPSILAAIPDLVPEERISSANSMNQFSYQFSTVLGQSSGGVLYAAFGAPVLFLIDGITFLFSAGSESFIQIPHRKREKLSSWKETIQSINQEMKEGLRYVWQWKGMRNFLLMVGVVHFFAMPYIVLMPFYVSLTLSEGPEWYGFLMAAFSAGSVVGYVFAGTIPISRPLRSRVLLLLLSASGILFGLLGQTVNPWVGLVTIFAAGALLGIFNIHVMTIYQTSTVSHIRGRVMGLVMTIANAASPLGMMAGGIAGDLTDKDIPLIYAVCGGLILLSVALIGSQHSVHEFLTSEVSHRDDTQ